MGQAANRRKWRRKLMLMHRQKGSCYWCNCKMILLPVDLGRLRPLNLATIDHLRDRFHPLRREPSRNCEERTVLACWRCNNERGSAAQAAQPIEELRRRSRQHEVA